VGLEMAVIERRTLIGTYDRLPTVGDGEGCGNGESQVSAINHRIVHIWRSSLLGIWLQADLESAHGHVCEDGSGGATRQAVEYVYFLPGGDATLYIMGAVFVAIIAIKVASG
jgi:hypothetical protein